MNRLPRRRFTMVCTVAAMVGITMSNIAIAATNENDTFESGFDSWLESEHVLGRHLFESRIVGGTTATEGEFPFFGTLWNAAVNQKSLYCFLAAIIFSEQESGSQ
jgi:hypothetical protein